jgi:hypothetical protein
MSLGVASRETMRTVHLREDTWQQSRILGESQKEESIEISQIENLGVLLTRGRALVFINPERNRMEVL